jgi:hypothetical protein
VSFDIFLQRFDEDAPDDRNAVLTVLAPFITGPGEECARMTTEDGEADVYGIGTDSLMINHASGQHIWQIMINVARAANMVIMPIGCPGVAPVRRTRSVRCCQATLLLICS